MSPRWRVNLLYALLCLVWSSTWLAIRLGVDGVPPFVAAASRMLVAGSLLVTAALQVGVRFPRTRLFALQVAVQGAAQFGFNFALIYWAEQYIPSGLTAVLFAVTPLMTAMSAACVFRIERLHSINIAGLVLGFAGVAIIYWGEVIRAAHAPALAVLAVLLASAIVSNASVFAKRWGEQFEPLAVVGSGQLAGGIVLATLALITEHGQAIHINARTLGALAYLIVFGSIIAYVTFFYLLRRLSVTKLSLITYVTPVLAVLLGNVVLREALAPATFFGTALVLIGISFVYRKAHPDEPDIIVAQPCNAAEPVPQNNSSETY